MEYNNYILYKKIFNNIYLSKIIFQYIYEINLNILKNNEESQNQTQKINTKKFFIKDIPFELILKSDNPYLFRDMIKSKRKLESSFCIFSLISFLKKYSISAQEIQEFYCLNKDLLNQKQSYNMECDSNHERSDIFEVLAESNHFEFLKIVYQENKELIEYEKQLYYSIENRDSSIKVDENLSKKFQFTPIFKVYYNKQILRKSFFCSSLDIIKYLIDIMKIDYKKYNDHLLYWSLISNNRRSLVHYLFHQLNYIIPELPLESIKNDQFKKEELFKNLLLIDNKLFLKVLNSKFMLNLNQIDYDQVVSISISIIQDKKNKNLPFQNDQLDLILNSINFLYFKTNLIDFKILLKMVKKLLKLNNNNNNNQLNENNENFNEVSILEKIIEKENQSIFNNLSNLFSNNSFKNTINNDIKYKELEKYSTINFENYNLEREIKRIFIFKFLNRNSILNNEQSINQFHSNVIYFATKFNQFEIIECLLNLYDFHRVNGLFNNYRMSENNILFVKAEIFNNIFAYDDSTNLYFFTMDKKIKAKQNYVIKLYELNSNLNYNFKLLSLFLKYDDKILFKKLFFSIQDFVYSNKEEYLNKYIEILQEFYQKNENSKFEAYNLIELNLSKYLFKEYNYLFIDWEENFFKSFGLL